jgi:hypothetical protein
MNSTMAILVASLAGGRILQDSRFHKLEAVAFVGQTASRAWAVGHFGGTLRCG